MSVDIVSKLIEVGGPELLLIKDKDGDITLHNAYFYNEWSFIPNPGKFGLLVTESILANIGGEFGIGGLFNIARQEVQNRILKKWKELSPTLKSKFETLQEEHQPPILHAAILAKAPLYVIQEILNKFQYSILKVDSLGRYPISIALEEGLQWGEGLQDIVKTTSRMAQSQQPTKIMHSTAQYGLKWRHCMKELAEANVDEIVNGYDNLTGLRLFMLAAMGDFHDLSSIYGMMKMGPEINVRKERQD